MAEDRKTELKPVYSMDVMRLMNINELSKTADTFYIQMEQGARQQIIPFRATLKVLWSKIKRFVTDKYPDKANKILLAFESVDKTFNVDFIDKNDEEKFVKARTGLIELRELFDELIDEIWTKVYEVLPEDERARLYSLGRA